MISSSYYPPSSGSTPQRPTEMKSESKEAGSPRSPNFYEMPTTEILSSATTRSAFLQSLQRSREREERREKELAREREKEKGYGYSPLKHENGLRTDPVNYSTEKYDNYSTGKLENYSTGKSDYNSANYTAESTHSDQSNLGTPIMSRRRLTSSPASSSKSSKSIASTTPIKPLNAATPVSQSKLASHAFTMSRSSNDDETERKEEDPFTVNGMGSMTVGSYENDFKRRYEEEFGRKQVAIEVPKIAVTPVKPGQSQNDDLRSLIDSVVESHTLSLKNDLQNLHIELIKQSVAQQSAFRSLLETYLPLTGKLMESLKETREENERLKMRIEELSRSRF